MNRGRCGTLPCGRSCTFRLRTVRVGTVRYGGSLCHLLRVGFCFLRLFLHGLLDDILELGCIIEQRMGEFYSLNPIGELMKEM